MKSYLTRRRRWQLINLAWLFWKDNFDGVAKDLFISKLLIGLPSLEPLNKVVALMQIECNWLTCEFLDFLVHRLLCIDFQIIPTVKNFNLVQSRIVHFDEVLYLCHLLSRRTLSCHCLYTWFLAIELFLDLLLQSSYPLKRKFVSSAASSSFSPLFLKNFLHFDIGLADLSLEECVKGGHMISVEGQSDFLPPRPLTVLFYLLSDHSDDLVLFLIVLLLLVKVLWFFLVFSLYLRIWLLGMILLGFIQRGKWKLLRRSHMIEYVIPIF